MDLASRVRGVTTMAQLNFEELLDRGVPLAAAEAVALTLAAGAVRNANTAATLMPPLEQILLSSTGDVVFADGAVSSSTHEGLWLASVLYRLLRLHERGESAHSSRGRLPGGLLVLVARMRGEIDLPPLGPDAFRAGLQRFSAGLGSGALAAVFWRAARMRSRQRDTTLSGVATPAARVRGERRSGGPSTSDLRGWLRQAERELFAERQRIPARAARLLSRATHSSGRVAAVAGVMALVAAAALWVTPAPPAAGLSPGNLVILGTPNSGRMVPAVLTSTSTPAVRRALEPEVPSPPTRANVAKNLRISEKIRKNRPKARQSTMDSHAPSREPVRTVRLVNLPRASWVEVQETRRTR